MGKDIKVQEHHNQLLEALTLSSLAKKSSGSDERKMTPICCLVLKMLINVCDHTQNNSTSINRLSITGWRIQNQDTSTDQ